MITVKLNIIVVLRKHYYFFTEKHSSFLLFSIEEKKKCFSKDWNSLNSVSWYGLGETDRLKQCMRLLQDALTNPLYNNTYRNSLHDYSRSPKEHSVASSLVLKGRLRTTVCFGFTLACLPSCILFKLLPALFTN